MKELTQKNKQDLMHWLDYKLRELHDMQKGQEKLPYLAGKAEAYLMVKNMEVHGQEGFENLFTLLNQLKKAADLSSESPFLYKGAKRHLDGVIAGYANVIRYFRVMLDA